MMFGAIDKDLRIRRPKSIRIDIVRYILKQAMTAIVIGLVITIPTVVDRIVSLS